MWWTELTVLSSDIWQCGACVCLNSRWPGGWAEVVDDAHSHNKYWVHGRALGLIWWHTLLFAGPLRFGRISWIEGISIHMHIRVYKSLSQVYWIRMTTAAGSDSGGEWRHKSWIDEYVFAYLLPTRPWTYLVFCNNVWNCIHIMLYGFESRNEIIPRILWTWGDG